MMDSWLAKVCACCPLCVLRRRWPKSGYARLMTRLERNCPFCKAYDRVHMQKADPKASNDKRL